MDIASAAGAATKTFETWMRKCDAEIEEDDDDDIDLEAAVAAAPAAEAKEETKDDAAAPPAAVVQPRFRYGGRVWGPCVGVVYGCRT